MVLDDETGIWSVEGTGDWDRKFYTISLQVYSYAADAIVSNEVTDPYSVSLATDSVRSQFVNLDDEDLKPGAAGVWDDMAWPELVAPEDSVIYELHVRDFSSYDPDPAADSESDNLKDADRGKFTAFADPDFVGVQHLQQLKQAGLTHLHILPAFDIATVKEDRNDRVEIDDPVEDLCAANTEAADLCRTDAGKTIRQAMEDAVASGWLERPQEVANWMRGLDGFNWGYDPYHFGVPEGSYSTNPNGEARIREFRAMVLGLNELGLRTVMDVVYNHTNASGQNPKSVLDKVVPGYYHRRNNTTGRVLGDSCCDDTAAEFRMMEKLMIDTGVRWVRDYKVSGFRFDLMSFHPLESMTRFRDAVQDPSQDGDPSVYIYGEGWNFGAIQNDKRFKAARQANLGGTGIGSFSDRIRDPLKGGGCCDGGDALVKNQGFVNGWYYDPNSANTGSTAERQALITSTDNIRVWLAGGLKNYQLQNAAGATVSGAAIDYSDQPSGYTLDPQEAINYVEKHDNQTLWDFGAYRHPDATSLSDRVRAHNVGLAVILLSQGVPFVHAGSDILRSKSGDRDSYDSGDWFNQLEWTLGGTKWAQGLPIADKNENEWPILEGKYQTVPRPDQAAQQRAFDHVREMLKIRKSSGLFRLRDAAQVERRVKFLNTGPSQIPGVIAMEIDGCTNPNEPVPDRGAIMTIFNASDEAVTLPLLGSESWTLDPVLASESTDPVVKTAKHDSDGFFVPARTTAVFGRAEQRSCSPFPVDLYVRGSFNDWANPPLAAYKLNFLGGTDYTVSAPVTFPANFKIASADWSASAYDCGAVVDGANVSLGVPFTLTCPGSKNLALQGIGDGDYTFSLDATSTTNPVLTVTKSPPTALTLYVRGGFTDWGTSVPLGWDGLDTYRATAAIADAIVGVTQEFKIADADWGNTSNGATNCGAGVGSDVVTIGQPYALTCDANPPNLKVTFPSAGSYLFAVDASNPASLQLTVERVPVDGPLFVRGIGGDWSDGAQNRMDYLGGGIYAINKLVAAAANEFKIADSNYNPFNCGGGSGGNDVTIGSPLLLACGTNPPNLNLSPATGGTYTFRFRYIDPASGEVTVTGP
jgi:pullulanase